MKKKIEQDKEIQNAEHGGCGLVDAAEILNRWSGRLTEEISEQRLQKLREDSWLSGGRQ